jgi:heme-degrading monooxygenase HmoA
VPLLSFTRLHLRAWYHLPAFLLHAMKSSNQAQRSNGFIAGGLSADLPHLTFWTVTLWRDEAAMRAFMLSDPHKTSMPRLGNWCDEAAVAHVEREGTELPTPEESLDFMRTRGRISRLPHPSARHAAGNTVPDGRPPLSRLRPLRPISAG